MIGRESARHGVSHSPVGPPVILSGQSVKRDVKSVNHLREAKDWGLVGRSGGDGGRVGGKRDFLLERRRKRQENIRKGR